MCEGSEGCEGEASGDGGDSHLSRRRTDEAVAHLMRQEGEGGRRGGVGEARCKNNIK